MAKKKEEGTKKAEITWGDAKIVIEPITGSFSNGEVEALRVKLNEVIAKINE